MRKALFVALALTLAACSADRPFYDRVDARLAADPALRARLGKPGPEMQSVAWLLGTWDIVAVSDAAGHPTDPAHGTSVVTAVAGGSWLEIRDTYPNGGTDIGYIGYDPATERWTGVNLDNLGSAVITRGRLHGQTLIVEGDVTVAGVGMHLRQSVTRQGENAYTVTNEERTPNGSWRPLDSYRYTRKP